MSYEPQLIINYTELDEHRGHINANAELGLKASIKLQDQRNAYRELAKALMQSVIIFEAREQRDELRLVIIQPELTKHNERVRHILDVLGVEYKVNY